MTGILRYCSPRFKAKLMEGIEPDWLVKHKRRGYIIQRILSAPDWVDRRALRALEAKAREISRITGIPHVLDHDVPLTHKLVCGLTVPWNLVVTTRAYNAWKSNAWCQWHGELFDQPEQLRLFL